jgi:hypothetical protein
MRFMSIYITIPIFLSGLVDMSLAATILKLTKHTSDANTAMMNLNRRNGAGFLPDRRAEAGMRGVSVRKWEQVFPAQEHRRGHTNVTELSIRGGDAAKSIASTKTTSSSGISEARNSSLIGRGPQNSNTSRSSGAMSVSASIPPLAGVQETLSSNSSRSSFGTSTTRLTTNIVAGGSQRSGSSANTSNAQRIATSYPATLAHIPGDLLVVTPTSGSSKQTATFIRSHAAEYNGASGMATGRNISIAGVNLIANSSGSANSLANASTSTSTSTSASAAQASATNAALPIDNARGTAYTIDPIVSPGNISVPVLVSGRHHLLPLQAEASVRSILAPLSCGWRRNNVRRVRTIS